MIATCDYCGRPAAWHAVLRTATMPLAFAYACDEHRLEDMVTIDKPLGRLPQHLSARETADVFYYLDDYREHDVDYEDQVSHSEEIEDEGERGGVDNGERAIDAVRASRTRSLCRQAPGRGRVEPGLASPTIHLPGALCEHSAYAYAHQPFIYVL